MSHSSEAQFEADCRRIGHTAATMSEAQALLTEHHCIISRPGTGTYEYFVVPYQWAVQATLRGYRLHDLKRGSAPPEGEKPTTS
ncbi:hypothetical protein [Alkalicoccus chagannorensis]|uniref:hypothetical protein n=1 Tax=Alkalicoccus chagannorensis TaxID=427072 RepID=UPI000422B575|nr:hypothetical protein [Alkalicoccus chagannorensis]